MTPLPCPRRLRLRRNHPRRRLPSWRRRHQYLANHWDQLRVSPKVFHQLMWNRSSGFDMSTHPLFEVFLQLPSAVVFSTSMQERNIAQRLLQENLWLLGLLSQELDWPRLPLRKQPEKQIEKLVPGHTSHAFESLGSLLFCFLCRSPG